MPITNPIRRAIAGISSLTNPSPAAEPIAATPTCLKVWLELFETLATDEAALQAEQAKHQAVRDSGRATVADRRRQIDERKARVQARNEENARRKSEMGQRSLKNESVDDLYAAIQSDTAANVADDAAIEALDTEVANTNAEVSSAERRLTELYAASLGRAADFGKLEQFVTAIADDIRALRLNSRSLDRLHTLLDQRLARHRL